MIRGAALVLVTVCGATGACASKNEELPELWYASRGHHTIETIPDSLRIVIAANPARTDRIEDAILGHGRAPVEFVDTALFVWWLADSGRPKYLPTLLRFAEHADSLTASMALYGLARHSGEVAVRSRLLQLDASAPPPVRNSMAAMLAHVNDSSARSLMAELSHKELSPQTLYRIETALSVRALPAGKGRWPCLPNDRRRWDGRCRDEPE